MRKLKTILPTLKERKRFIAYELLSRKNLQKGVSELIAGQVRNSLGTFGSARAGVLSIDYDRKSQKGILRVSNDMLDEARTSLSLIRGVDKTQVLPRTLGISGSLKKTRQKYTETEG